MVQSMACRNPQFAGLAAGDHAVDDAVAQAVVGDDAGVQRCIDAQQAEPRADQHRPVAGIEHAIRVDPGERAASAVDMAL
jgi:hypothetical protein